MASSRERQRALARAKLERQMARRASEARRRRQVQAGVAVFLAVALLAVGGWFLWKQYGPKDEPTAAEPTAGPCAYTEVPAESPNPDPSGAPVKRPKELKDVGIPPAGTEVRQGTQLMTVTTNQGVIKIQLDLAKAPCNSASLAYLAGKKFYDNSKCHRMTTQNSYMLQCGDPTATGSGGPTYKTNDENLPVDQRPAYPAGTVAMANSGPATNGSQLFIVYKDSEFDGPKYTIVGIVIEGLQIIEKIAQGGLVDAQGKPAQGEGAPKTPVTITAVTMSPPTTAAPSPPSPTPAASPSASAAASP